MTGRYHVLPAADRDLDDQAAYLATEASLEVALRFYDAASITFGKIASTSGIGERWPSANRPDLTSAESPPLLISPHAFRVFRSFRGQISILPGCGLASANLPVDLFAASRLGVSFSVLSLQGSARRLAPALYAVQQQATVNRIAPLRKAHGSNDCAEYSAVMG